MFMHLNHLGLHQSGCFHHIQYSSLPYQRVSRLSTRFLEPVYFFARLSWHDLGLEKSYEKEKREIIPLWCD